jgi:ABC-type enterochelin transport system permease subunit
MTAGVPIFDNKRRLIYQKTTDLDIRCASGQASIAAGPTSVWVKQDKVQLATGDAAEAGVLGTSYRSAEDQLLTGLKAGLTAMQTAAVGPLSPLAPGLGTMIAAITAFQNAASADNGFLSQLVYLK